jgi:hypothetical protein
MNAQDLRALVEDATNSYASVDIDYKKHLLDYGVGLLVGQLSVIGFLLQNHTTQNLLRSLTTKIPYLIMLTLTFLSIAFSILAKRIQRDYQKNMMYSHQYRAMANPGVNVTIEGIDRPPQDSDMENASTHVRKAITLEKWMKRAFSISELFLITALVAAMVFVFILVIKL